MVDNRCIPSGTGFILIRSDETQIYVSKEALDDAKNWVNTDIEINKEIFKDLELNDGF